MNTENETLLSIARNSVTHSRNTLKRDSKYEGCKSDCGDVLRMKLQAKCVFKGENVLFDVFECVFKDESMF